MDAEAGSGLRAIRQGDALSTRRHGGLGSVLRWCSTWSSLRGGSVSAESQGEEKGATFTVLPPTMSIGHGGVNGARVPTPTPHALATVRVLLIEDEPDSRDLARA